MNDAGAGVALLFPGQGSHRDGMRELVEEHRAALLELARDLIGADPFDRLDQGTRYAQPALYCASIACWTAAGGPRASLIAGHSLGELAALAAGGAIGEEEGLRLAVTRGDAMQRAAKRGPEGGMIAVLGDDEAASELAARFGLALANSNAPGQTVLSGTEPGLSEALAAARAERVRTVRLEVGGAFHSPAMLSAVPEFREALDRVDFAAPSSTVFCCTAARPFMDVRAELADALTRPVRWRETLAALREAGARRFVEAGPGKVLANIVRRCFDDVEVATLDPELATGV